MRTADEARVRRLAKRLDLHAQKSRGLWHIRDPYLNVALTDFDGITLHAAEWFLQEWERTHAPVEHGGKPHAERETPCWIGDPVMAAKRTPHSHAPCA
ncbi:MAG TPA: hypothetical protein VK395_38100 [Gemmataceae bacterium]|nr:hypothetical protein [Gemmataceae bacterium]